MSTLSVPLNRELDEFVEMQVKEGEASNKADVVRRALLKMKEDVAFERLKQSVQDVKDGNVFEGDLKDLVTKL
jgi:putative addiction module CopG family antidote